MAGFAKFRSQLEQRQLRSGALAQIYGNLRRRGRPPTAPVARMNLHADADRLWPRLELGRMAREDVLQIWATCPANKLPELDLATAKVLNTAKQLEPWQLLSASRREMALKRSPFQPFAMVCNAFSMLFNGLQWCFESSRRCRARATCHRRVPL